MIVHGCECLPHGLAADSEKGTKHGTEKKSWEKVWRRCEKEEPEGMNRYDKIRPKAGI